MNPVLQPTPFTLQVVALRDFFDDEEDYEDVCSAIDHDFSWGDTNYALVSKAGFLASLERRMGYRPDKDNLLSRLHNEIDSVLAQDTFISL